MNVTAEYLANIREELDYYDALPSELRAAVNECSLPVDCVSVYLTYRRDWMGREREMAQMIRGIR